MVSEGVSRGGATSLSLVLNQSKLSWRMAKSLSFSGLVTILPCCRCSLPRFFTSKSDSWGPKGACECDLYITMVTIITTAPSPSSLHPRHHHYCTSPSPLLHPHHHHYCTLTITTTAPSPSPLLHPHHHHYCTLTITTTASSPSPLLHPHHHHYCIHIIIITTAPSPSSLHPRHHHYCILTITTTAPSSSSLLHPHHHHHYCTLTSFSTLPLCSCCAVYHQYPSALPCSSVAVFPNLTATFDQKR